MLTPEEVKALKHIGQMDGLSILRNENIDGLVAQRLVNRTRENREGLWVYPLILTDKGREALEGS